MDVTKLYKEFNQLNDDHILYLVVLENKDEKFCKIGITSKTVQKRMDWIENYDYKLIDSIKDNGFIVRGIESLLKEKVLDFNKHHKPIEKLFGYTECYKFDYLEDIKKAFKYIKKKKNKITKEITEEKVITIVEDYDVKYNYLKLKYDSLKDQFDMINDRLNHFEPEFNLWEIDDDYEE